MSENTPDEGKVIYTEKSYPGSRFESVDTASLTRDGLLAVIENEGFMLVRHTAEPDGEPGCGQLVLKDAGDLAGLDGDQS